MAFVDERLPEDVERGASGGPRFNTTVLTLSSGFEKRNQNWASTLGLWDISYGIQYKEDFEAVLAFFYNMGGQANSFRFKDWTDFEIGDDETDTPQTIATADGIEDEFQIVRRYVVGANTYERTIILPIASTVRVFVDAVEKTLTTHYTIEPLGIIKFTLGNIPTVGQLVRVICEFDVPVRFDTDHLPLTAATFRAASVQQIPITEVRELG